MFLRNVAFLLAFGSLAAPASALNLKPGKWQITVEMQMSGVRIPPATTTQCITREEAESPDGALPHSLGNGKDDDCKLSDVKMEGDSVAFRLTCPKKQVTAEGTFHYAGDAYDGTMRINMPSGELTQKFAGKHVGECER